MGDVVKYASKAKPVLSGDLLEGLFAECISQVKMSLDCCHNWKEGNLSLEENIVATKIITRDEIWNVVDVTQHHTKKTMRPKQWYFRKRCERYLKDESELEVTKDSPVEEIAVCLKLLIKCLGDLHMILAESTPPAVREYLVHGKEAAREFEEREKKRKSRGSLFKATRGLSASKRTVAKGSKGNSAPGSKGPHKGRVRKRRDDQGSGRASRGNSPDDPSLEAGGEVGAISGASVRYNTGARPRSDSSEGGEHRGRGDGGSRGGDSSPQGSDGDVNGDDAGSSSEGDGLSERGSIQAASGDQGSVGGNPERVGFGPENMGLGRPGEDFDNGYLRRIEQHGTISRSESSAHRGEVREMITELNQMIEALQGAADDMARFEGGNDAAGRRVRKVCAEVGKACKGIRADVQSIRNDRKG